VISQNGAELVTVPAFSEVSFQVTIQAGNNSKHGDEVVIVVSAKPISVNESYHSDYTAKETMTIQVSISNPFNRIWDGVVNPGIWTIMIGLAIIILVVASVTGRRNRIEYIDVWVDDDEVEGQSEFELPDIVSAEDDDFYDEEDIELVNLD
jgi:hypothetical protein